MSQVRPRCIQKDNISSKQATLETPLLPLNESGVVALDMPLGDAQPRLQAVAEQPPLQDHDIAAPVPQEWWEPFVVSMYVNFILWLENIS